MNGALQQPHGLMQWPQQRFYRLNRLNRLNGLNHY
jgi:hypothetical protein